MRALKTILIIVAALAGLWLIISLFSPPGTNVVRTTTIKAQPATIYTYISKLKNMDEWGVWHNMDKNAVYTSEGEDGTVGFRTSWNGDTVMQGSQTITALEPDKSVKTDLAFGDFLVSKVSLDLAPKNDSTEVTWSLTNDIPFQWRAIMMFMGMGSGIEKDFDTGLANLKTICESKQAEADKAKAAEPSYAVAVSEWPAKLWVGKREVVKWSDMKDFYTKHFGEGMAAVGKAGVPPAGAPSGVYFEWNEKEMTADMIAAIPVAMDAKAKLKGLDMYESPASKALTIDYYGGYSNMMAPHTAMDAYIKANNYTHHSNVIEEYLTDPGSEPDSTKWLTRITYLVK